MNWIGRAGIAAHAVLSAGAVFASAGEIEVDLRVSVPLETPAAAVVYVAGDYVSLGQWNPGKVALERQADGRWGTTLRLPDDRAVQFKFTLGGWDRVETNKDGSERENRTWAVGAMREAQEGGKRPVIEQVVQKWSVGKARAGTGVTGDLRQHMIHSAALACEREIFVWLPQGYSDQAAAAYPVIYFHDGQNCFDSARSAFGVEWGLDEAMTALVAGGKVGPAVIVGISNSGARLQEYSPTFAGRMNPTSQAYERMVIEEVLPFVEAHYRVSREASGRSIAGSSLGGLITLSIISHHPEMFGSAAIVSPSLWWDSEHDLKAAEVDARWAAGRRIWVDMGSAEGQPPASQVYVTQVERLAAALRQGGAVAECRIVPGAGHNEAAWAARAGEILSFLLSRPIPPDAKVRQSP